MTAPTYFGSNSNPTDNGTLGEPTTGAVITPPNSMQAGDLVIVCWSVGSPSSVAQITLNATGGQSWTKFLTDTSQLAGTIGMECYWCEYNGTWGTSPSWDLAARSGTERDVGVMHVFRKPGSAGSWSLDGSAAASFGAGPTPVITGRTTGISQTVTLAGWFSTDDNTWGTLSGSGWAVSGGAQYRNTTGQDMSSTFAHFLADAASTATGNVSKTQLTLGNDTSLTLLVTFGCPVLEAAFSQVQQTIPNFIFTRPSMVALE